MSQREMLRSAEMAAAVISGTGRKETHGQLVPIMVRVPIWVASQIDAIAKRTGRSRAATVTMLCEVGLEEVQQLLDESVVKDLVELEAQAMGQLMDGETTSGEV